MSEGLNALAAALGVEGSDPETLRVVLRALGEQALDQPETGLAEHRIAAWRSSLPACIVAGAGQPIAFAWRIAARDMDTACDWRIALESGETRTGSFEAAGFPITEGCDLAGEAYREVAASISESCPPGYHRLQIRMPDGAARFAQLLVTPAVRFRPSVLESAGRIWGPAVCLHALCSERNWGVGDFTDLKLMIEHWAAEGAQIVSVGPLHAQPLADPGAMDPYRPSSRTFLNVLHIDVEAVPDYAECETARARVANPEFGLRLERLRAALTLDYEPIAALKRPVLELLYRSFRERHLLAASARGVKFSEFRERGGVALQLYALFEVLHDLQRTERPELKSWREWPAELRDSGSPTVRQLAAEHAEAVEFHEYLQWQAALQLESCARRAGELGLAIGLCMDVAAGASADGADAWARNDLSVPDVRAGVAPDEFDPRGRDLGVAALAPAGLAGSGLATLVEPLRAAMRIAGAVRLDRVEWLFEQYWIAEGRPADTGVRVRYPRAALLAAISIESSRNRCAVIGATDRAPSAAVAQALTEAGVLAFRAMLGSSEAARRFGAPVEYPAEAVLALGDADSPTLNAFWLGSDLVRRSERDDFGSPESREAQVVGRAQDRARLLLALEREGLLPSGATVNPVSIPTLTEDLVRAVHLYLARTPASVVLVRLPDLHSDQAPPAAVATTETESTWRSRLAIPMEDWPTHGAFARLATDLRTVRGGRKTVSGTRRTSTLVVPRATYRLQLNRQFTFADAADAVPYLARLGVSHAYLSPILKARSGSLHGYDIIDHESLNPEIGTPESFERYCRVLCEHGMNQILDVVPNHMGVMGADNRWWLDLLENGPASVFAPYFDVDWRPAKIELTGKVLLPILAERYGDILERGELKLVFDSTEGSFSIWYYQHRLPVAPREYPRLLRHRLDALELRLGAEDPLLHELASLITAFEHLPPRDVTDPERILERHRDRELHKRRLARLVRRSAAIAQHVTDSVRAYNGTPGDPASFDLLHGLLEHQAYRVADWHSASDEINYRRFFDINDLAGLRAEDPRVFDATHPLVLRLLAEGKAQGLRIDHPDGLNDPAGYFRRLQARAALALDLPSADGQGAVQPAVWLVVEKILAPHEALPESWPVHGTTGYDFANLVNELFVAKASAPRLERLFRTITGYSQTFEETLYACKRLIIKYALASELTVLANALNRVSEHDRHTRDFTLNRLRQALAEVVAWLPVYRTYINDGQISEQDRRYIEWAAARARKHAQAEDTRIFDFVRKVLLLEGEVQEERGEALRGFVQRFQQYTGPVMAKAMEDTAFYRYFPLASLNEVGGDPTRAGLSVKAYHSTCQRRLQRWPHAMLAGSTHDNKRSEDVRARLNVLSEMPVSWRRSVLRWARLASGRKKEVDGEPAPSMVDEYLLYQTLVGAWPLNPEDRAEFARRIEHYVVKAAREAKLRTSWTNTNAAYEDALVLFVRAVLDGDPRNVLRAEIEAFAQNIAWFGIYNSLSQTLLRLTSPGVPDIYQGAELFDFSLVDPDNRRPIDFVRRARMLTDLEANADGGGPWLRSLLDAPDADALKLYTIWKTLQLRRQQPAVFAQGTYRPLTIEGQRAPHVVAFARRHNDCTAIVVVPRLIYTLSGGERRPPLGEEIWGGSYVNLGPLKIAGLTNTFTGATLRPEGMACLDAVPCGEALRDFPIALLVTDAEKSR